MPFERNENFSKNIRVLTVKMVHKAKASHVGGALSMVDILSVLYNCVLNINPLNPGFEDRDRFILSKGHACASLYATLALKGFFPIDELETYAQNGSRLLSHTSHYVPGVEISAGSLGHGLPISVGLALAAKRKQKNWKTYCLISDGELDEGSNWEAILMVPHQKLNNLTLIIDYNKIQSLGNTNDVINVEPLPDKLKAFHWNVLEIDGHNHKEIFHALTVYAHNQYPKAIIAHTVKGKGVSFMENLLEWHYKSPTNDQLEKAMEEIE